MALLKQWSEKRKVKNEIKQASIFNKYIYLVFSTNYQWLQSKIIIINKLIIVHKQNEVK